jgi:hypothetical protein
VLYDIVLQDIVVLCVLLFHIYHIILHHQINDIMLIIFYNSIYIYIHSKFGNNGDTDTHNKIILI